MFYSSFATKESQAPPVFHLSEDDMLILARVALRVPKSQLSVRTDLRVVCHQMAPGRYAYVRFYETGEMELFLPRTTKKALPC